ncbi:MAG: hypothetical protein K8U03_02150 [Planctomycetia bacterium]|nr:hypothetical protein [Planctomycetia bacterium]
MLVVVIGGTGVFDLVALRAAGEAGDTAESRNVPDAVPQVVTEARALVHSSMTALETAQREKLLLKAQTLLEEFLKENPTHINAPYAEMQLGVVLTTAGKADASDARQVEAPADRDALLDLARQRFRAAEKLFTTVIDQFQNRLRSFSKFPKEGMSEAETRRRDRLRGDLMQALMYQAGVLEELAGTYPLESSEARENYQAAADRYEQIYKDYRTLIAGLMARLKQGMCYKNLGEPRRALGLYNDLLTQPDEIKPLHRMRVAAMYLSLECWTTEQEKLYELAFSQGEEYLTHLPHEEESWPEWQAVRYFTARGYLLAAMDKKKKPSPADRGAWLVKARTHAEPLTKKPGPYQAAADQLLIDLDGAGGKSN